MNFESMLSPLGWTTLALVPPAIVALYFLKLRRRPVEVPSTFLWRKSIEDLHVNSLWQKLRKNLLLWLQLLAVLLVMLALLRPTWQGTQLVGDRYIFLVDNSASMSARDVAPTRLDEAKKQVEALIDEMGFGASAMLISFNRDAKIEQTFTSSRRDLRAALERIQATQAATHLDEALKLAAAQANRGRTASDPGDAQVPESEPATLYIFSDGRFPDVKNFSLQNLEPVYVPIGSEAAQNAGILAFSTARNEEKLDKLEALVRVGNFGTEPAPVMVGLYRDGGANPADDTLIDSRETEVAAEGVSNVTFELGELDEARLEARLETLSDGRLSPSAARDDLALDNRAWTTVATARRAPVLVVGPENPVLKRSLSTNLAQLMADVRFETPAFLTSPEYQQLAAAGELKLVVFDRCQPLPAREGEPPLLPQCSTLFLAALPPVGAWEAGEKIVAPQIVDTDRAHPLMQFVEMGNVLIAEATVLKPPPGARTLITSHAGPVAAVAARGLYEDAVLSFPVAEGETDWFRKLSWPPFVLNVLDYFGRRNDPRQLGVRVRETAILALPYEASELTVRGPDGQEYRLDGGAENAYAFSDTGLPGVYEVRRGEETVQSFAVNVFGAGESRDLAESNLPPRSKDEKLVINIGYNEVTGEMVRRTARREGWKWISLAVLAVLLGEWYIYNRRVYV